MRSVIIFLVFIFLENITDGQESIASGFVKSESGNPVPFAFVQEFKAGNASATYTDSVGFFNLPVSLYAKLKISCKGFNDTLVNITDKQRILVVLSKLRTAKSGSAPPVTSDNALINKNLIQDAVSTQTGVNNSYVYGGGTRNYTGSLMPVFTYKEDTKGSRYLLDTWMQGYAKDKNGQEIKNSRYLFNYDKMEGALLLTQDKQSAIAVDRTQITSFTVFVKEKTPIVFENVPAIDPSHFVQLIASGDKYKIYKLTKTKFVKSNYQTNGISASGNPYDEYVDENSYFCMTIADKKIQKFSLKKKAIKEVFPVEGNKVNEFFSLHSQEEINDLFLQNLIDSL